MMKNLKKLFSLCLVLALGPVHTAFAREAELGDEAAKGGSLTVFEKACDDAVLRAAGAARRVPFGVEVALGYLAAKEAEWMAGRTGLSGRCAGGAAPGKAA